MSEIDWSKAPEGAEFWNPNSELFYRSLDGEFQKFSETRGRWTIAAGERHKYQTMIAKPAPWTGEGLPPVGTVCERSFSCSTWKATTICGHSTDGAYAAFYDGDGLMGWADDCKLRPIRTPEQIAAEIRSKAITQLMCDLDVPTAIATRAYDAGYRKFEIIDEPKS